MPRILYKYLDINGGKCMIGNKNLQHTNASQLNDPFDCHPRLLDYSNIPDVYSSEKKQWYCEQLQNEALNYRNRSWLCSLSKRNDSILMWAHYCYNHKGICIGLDIDKVLACVPPMFGTIAIKPDILAVHYQDILERPDTFKVPRNYQFGTKAKEWEYEQEVRLVIEEPHPSYAAFTPSQAKEAKEHKGKIWDWKEIHHYQPLKEDCFDSIYFGINIDQKEKEKIINFALEKINPNTKLYQMQVDPDAFRLKPEPII